MFLEKVFQMLKCVFWVCVLSWDFGFVWCASLCGLMLAREMMFWGFVGFGVVLLYECCELRGWVVVVLACCMPRVPSPLDCGSSPQ